MSNDVVIVSTARTPLAKSWRGGLNMTHGATLAGHAIKHAVERSKVDPNEIEDVLMGCALPEGSTIDTPPLGGGHANVRLVSAGKADLALSHAMTNRWAAEGIVAYDAPIRNIRALMGGLDTYYLNITAAGAEPGADSSRAAPIAMGARHNRNTDNIFFI